MSPRPKLVLGLFALGLALRLLGLPLWGTFDVEVQKAWSWRAARVGVADIYGPSDDEIRRLATQRGEPLWRVTVPRTTFKWGTAPYFVDYPPGSVLVLWCAGKLHGLVDPEQPNRRLFNAAINLAPLVGSLAITWLLLRTSPLEHGARRALAFWLNPAVLLAIPVLGYQDSVFGAFAVLAVLSLMDGRHAAASALVVVAGLIKPQAALLVPVLAVVALRESGPRSWARCALAGLGAAALMLLPWWSQGHLLSALDGCRRPLTQTTLAPLGLNVWWIAGYAMKWSQTGAFPLAGVVGIDEFEAWAGWNPRVVARVLVGLATALVLVPLLGRHNQDRRLIPLAVILQVHAYALFATSVHENHTFLALALAPLLLGVWHRAKAMLVATSAFFGASVFLAAGFGRRITTQRWLETLRAATLVDLSVLVAAAHVVLLAALALWALRIRAEAR